jgi:ABC-type sugar transport system substrate-binding protein
MCNVLKDLPQKGTVLFVGTGVFNELKPYFESGLIHASVHQATREQGERAVTIMYKYLSGQNDFCRNELLPVVLVFKENAWYFMS